MTDDIRGEDPNDQELVGAARQLGVQAAGQLDLERTARGVVARWRAEQRRTITPLWRSPAMIRVAAAIILLVAGIETWEHRHRLPTQEAVAAEATDVGLEGLSTEQLVAILPGVDQAEDVETTASDAGLEGLSVDELKSVLNQMGS
jgi:hypothetical protein